MSEFPRVPAGSLPKSKFKIATDLPSDIYRGMGKVIGAHAILENRVLDLLFELMRVDPAVGRVATNYRAASERFKTIKRLLNLHGIKTTAPLNDLLNQITDCCDARDQFAHGVWIKNDKGELALQLTRGIYETPEGHADRSFLPEGRKVPGEYYEEIRNIILTTAQAVNALLKEVRAAFGEPVDKS